jgi:hypothetical protein
MKAWLSNKLALGLALVAAVLVGCTRRGGEQGTLVSTASAEPAVPADAEAVAATKAAEPEPIEVSDPAAVTKAPAPAPIEVNNVAPAPAPGAEKNPLPPNVRSTGPAADIMKMAQSGVDEFVMLTYITNTTTMFGLSSDEIIYLNDIGVPSQVVTAMIQRDQTLKEFWANNAKEQAAQAAAASATGAAPSYVNEPQPETTPVEAPLTPPPTDNYDSLAPYGTWISVEGYGRVWQPTVVVTEPGWAPYCNRGHWIYTDCGWYWMSDYSWGATAFHYGRWFNHARWGWCWWPDQVWGPSWVSWRYSGNYCGWAPLPPAACYRPGFGFSYYNSSVGVSFGFGLGASCYTFVPWRNFCDSRPYYHRVPHSQVNQVFNNTTVINNYGSGNNNTVVNHGISVDRVRERTRTDVRQVSIRDSATGRNGRLEHFDRDGRTLIVNRREAARPTAPATASTIDRGTRTESTSAFAPAGNRAITRQQTPDARTPERDQRQIPIVTQPSGRVVQGNSQEIRRDNENRRNDVRNNARQNNVQNQNNGNVETPAGREVRSEAGAPVVVTSPRNPPPAAPTVNNLRNAPATSRVEPQPRVESQPKVDSQPRQDIRLRGNARDSRPAANPIVVIGRPQPRDSVGNSADVQGRNENVSRPQQNYIPRIPGQQQSQSPVTSPVRTSPQFQTPSPSSIAAPRIERREADRSSRFDQLSGNSARSVVPQQSAPTFTPRAGSSAVTVPSGGQPTMVIPRATPASPPASVAPRSESRSAQPQAQSQSRSDTSNRGGNGVGNGGGVGGGRRQ